MGIDVYKQLSDILDEYSDEVKEIARAEEDRAGKRTASELRSVSPKGRKGKYASGWTKRRTDDDTVTVYNSKAPGLTHLLEKGHVIRNKKGYFGRAPAHPHIKPVEAKENEKFYDGVIRALGR